MGLLVRGPAVPEYADGDGGGQDGHGKQAVFGRGPATLGRMLLHQLVADGGLDDHAAHQAQAQADKGEPRDADGPPVLPNEDCGEGREEEEQETETEGRVQREEQHHGREYEQLQWPEEVPGQLALQRRPLHRSCAVGIFFAAASLASAEDDGLVRLAHKYGP